MNSKTENLQAILTEMFASKDRLTLDDMAAWREKYPHFSREIIKAYTDWRDFEFFVLEDEEALEIDGSISEKDKNFLDNLFAKTHAAPVETITDLREFAEKKGIDRKTLPEKLGVSETLMRKLERRNLKEIPSFIEKKMAEIFSVSTESWQAFFSLSATLPRAARYKSKITPRTQPKQTFIEAVENDPELSVEEKRTLLDLAKE